MASYIIPTVDEFILRFAGTDLADAEDDVIQQAITDAADYVDTSWRVQDYANAIMLLAAHWITSDASADASGIVKSESFGPISVSYGSRSTDNEALGSTQYGERFSALRRGNHGAPVLVV